MIFVNCAIIYIYMLYLLFPYSYSTISLYLGPFLCHIDTWWKRPTLCRRHCNAYFLATKFLHVFILPWTGHDDVIRWKHFPRYWPFVRGIHRWPENFPYKGQWRGALMLSLICAWINSLANNRETGDLRRHRAHYDVTVMKNWHYEVLGLISFDILQTIPSLEVDTFQHTIIMYGFVKRRSHVKVT